MTTQNPSGGQANGVAFRVILTMLAAGTLGGLLALPLGDQRRVSIETWLTVVSALLALAVIARMLKAAPAQAARRGPVLRRTEKQTGQENWLQRWMSSWTPPAFADRRLPRSLLPIQGQLLSARDNERAYPHRLRPRLIDLAEHYLRTDHGVTDLHQTDQVIRVLGDSAWLIDQDVAGRTPTLAEIEDLLNRLLSERIPAEGFMTE